MMKRAIVCALSCVMLVLYLACPLLAAEVVRPNAVAFTDSNAYADILAGSNGNTEAMQKYLKNDTKTEPEFVTAAEYGYYGAKDNSANYRLYVYIYNPSGTALPATGNTITLATKFSDQAKTDITAAGAMSYATFKLQAAAPQTANPDEYKNTLYKYYVDLHAYWTGNDAARKVDGMIVGNYRRYDISKVTINGVAVTVGNSLICEGLASENKTPVWKGIQTERLEVTPAVYRHMTDSNVNTQVNSVYFTVPDKYWAQRDGKDIYDLTEIKADWIEKRTTPMLVTIDKALNDEYVSKGVIGKNISDINPRPERSFYVGAYTDHQKDDTYFATERYFNPNEKDPIIRLSGCLQIFELYWMFYQKVDNLKDAKVTSAEMKAWYDEHPEWHDKMLQELNASDKNYSTRYGATITADRLINIPGRDVPGIVQWWENFLGYGYDYSSISDVSPIQCLTEEDWAELKGLSDDVLSKKYLISEDEVAGFREKMDEMIEKNKVKEKCRMVVFHFAVSDYEAYDTYVFTNGGIMPRAVYTDIAYVAQEHVFLNFDIIYMAFTSEAGDRLVVPTVMSPIDIISGVEPYAMADNISVIFGNAAKSFWDKLDELFGEFKKVLAVVLGLVLLVVCWPLITAVLRFLASILRGVGRGANRLMDVAKRRRNKHKKE